MTDPYKVLGISPSATDEEVRNAYRRLLQQYGGDERKIAEINEAFDRIMNMRRDGGQYSSGNSYPEIRYQIQNGNYNEADRMLDGISERPAEWYFLKGSVCYAKGWLNDAYTNFSRACRMEPYNTEYNSALRHMSESGKGRMRGDPSARPYSTSDRSYGCSVCDVCNGLICADCCCECMGGDFIPCC